jgi:hypothetical protein
MQEKLEQTRCKGKKLKNHQPRLRVVACVMLKQKLVGQASLPARELE